VSVTDRRIDFNELRRRVRRRGLLRVLVEGPVSPPPAPPSAPEPPDPAPAESELEWRVEGEPAQPGEPDPQETIEFEIDPEITEKLRGCQLSCAAVITGLADLPALEVNGKVLEVALLRMTVRRPGVDAECCVRQHIPPEIRGVVGPGAGLMVLAHDNDRSVAVADWTATGEWIGAKLTFPTAHEQYDWPPRADWPEQGAIEIHDENGHREELDERRGRWSLASAGLVSLTPLRSRVDQRDEWRIELQLADGSTVEIVDRMPMIALARLKPGNESRVGTPIDVLVSTNGAVAVDWEATLRQPELRAAR
jgi:hypothetical protein